MTGGEALYIGAAIVFMVTSVISIVGTVLHWRKTDRMLANLRAEADEEVRVTLDRIGDVSRMAPMIKVRCLKPVPCDGP